ncbi:phenylalanine--tRNA ligase subunit alpha [Thermotoga sp. KOL6]|uniref:phenylalanine--tRNA ligase subunit alpha n=1 Tax=Thermotoga sp. KOL6 TaxID=126741 RepID=UPI000C75DD5A|nr:phenylalanine--tRNA ligase subunit alpha [Thermotoga sp. KOL6]PLV58307.1 phenylalanine--tRNA ligase subunit alpha [Thermotoga sp. KOL6]
MNIDVVEREAFERLSKVSSAEELEQFRVEFLGKKGKITSLMKNLKNLPPEERPTYGKRVNELREKVEALFREKKKQIEELMEKEKMERMRIDVTIPGARRKVGHSHPVAKIMEEIERIFVAMGFDVVEGPEIETTWYNFDALNTPEWHPARDEHDSFYITDDLLLRTHTSPVQVRTMLERKPPIAIISPGKVYRRDYDATHLPMFHQVEGLHVDKDLSVAHLKFTLEEFARRMFGESAKVRLRPSFFPFTEPSFEVDVYLKGYGWLEILGAGMVDPNVFLSVGYDPEEWTGYAFGMGVERIAMLKYGITDIREFVRNDVRFLSSY